LNNSLHNLVLAGGPQNTTSAHKIATTAADRAAAISLETIGVSSDSFLLDT
jgi:hypothetical protein